MHPKFVNVDASFNLPFYHPEDPDTIIATMGCRTRTLADRFGRNRQSGKGNLSFNTINLVKLGIRFGICQGARAVADRAGFYTALESVMHNAASGLLHRYRIQTLQPAKASDFMMREGVCEGGEQLGPNEPVAELLKHGTLSLGFIGLAECMTALYGRHHGQDPHVHREALNIIRTMREFCDRMSEDITEYHPVATPAEGLSGKFTKIDRERYGIIPGVNDREYYTNSFHIPVYHTLPAYRKIELEAPFHTLCNAGAISYVELDGNVRANTAAFLRIVQYALAQDIGLLLH